MHTRIGLIGGALLTKCPSPGGKPVLADRLSMMLVLLWKSSMTRGAPAVSTNLLVVSLVSVLDMRASGLGFGYTYGRDVLVCACLS